MEGGLGNFLEHGMGKATRIQDQNQTWMLPAPPQPGEEEIFDEIFL